MKGSARDRNVLGEQASQALGAPDAGDSQSDLRTVARGGVLNLLGSISNAGCGFLVVVIITHGFGRSTAGVVFESIALFSILGAVSQWGVGVGLVRMVPRYLVAERHQEIVHLIRAALVPVCILSVAIAGLAIGLSVPIGRLVTNGIESEQMAMMIRALPWFLPAFTTLTVALAATQGFGTMVPTNVLDKGARAVLQPIVVAAALASGVGVVGVGVAWATPFLFALVGTLVWLRVLIRRSSPDASAASRSWGTPVRAIYEELWLFSAPRGLAGVFAVVILWLDTLLLGSFRSPQEAAVYAAATRYLSFGLFIGTAILQVVAPKMSELLAKGSRERVARVYTTSTTWLMVLAWPLYFTMISFPSGLLSVFGPGYRQAEPTLVILGVAMLVATAVGPVDVVLLMAGKSSWNLMNTVVAVIANIGLNLLLIPRMGLSGAAIAWAVSIALNNLLPMLQVWWILHLHPFSKGSVVAASVSAGPFLLFALGFRAVWGSSFRAFVVWAVIAFLIWAVEVWFFRRPLGLSDLVDRKPPGSVKLPRR